MDTPRTFQPAIAIVFLLALALAGTTPITAASQPVPGNDVAPPRPRITYTEAADDDERAVMDWAVARYAEAGLIIPELEVSFPVTCDGKGARYLVGQARIEICRLSRVNALHELAHAWDDAGDIADRARFMADRDVDHWMVQVDRPSVESGGEQLAQIIAWGLMDIDTTVAQPTYSGQPREEQPRQIPGLPSSSVAELHEAFVSLTGIVPLHETL
jgi:hypothetical protein